MRSKYISINPKIQFGDPCIKGTRIQTAIIHNLFKGGEKVKDIAAMYELKTKQVVAAIKFHRTYCYY